MKRKIALVLVLALALALCACGSRNLQPDEVQLPEENTQNASPEGDNPTETTAIEQLQPPVVAVTPTVVVTAFPVPSSTPEPTPTIAPTPTVPPTPAPDGFAAPTATATDEEKENGHYAYVQGSGINMRAGVGTGTDIIDVVNIADKVYVIGEENGWTKVIFNNKVGYIYSPFVSTTYPNVNNEIVPNTPSNEGNATIIDPSGNSTVISGGGADSAGTGVIVLG